MNWHRHDLEKEFLAQNDRIILWIAGHMLLLQVDAPIKFVQACAR